MVWDPSLSNSVIRAIAVANPPFPGSTPFSIHNSARRAHVFGDAAGIEHIFLVGAAGTVQLAVIGASVFEPVYLLTELKTERPCKARLEAIEIFHALSRSKGGSARSADRARSGRLQIVLQALDASLNGVSHRGIAEALYGAMRARKDWRDPRGHMRDAVRRAIRRGRHLMESGYLGLLA